MKWTMKDPARGDMIRVGLGTLYHFGIFVSEEEVIQFGPPPTLRGPLPDAAVEVITTDIDGFLAGGFLEVCEFDRKEKKKHRGPDEIVSVARSRLGEKGYHILYNNCEHFAHECVSGEHICHQADDVRAMFRSLPVVDVYLMALPEAMGKKPLSLPAREKEIASVGDEAVKKEKYYVWRLLEYALERSFGFKARELSFWKEENGAWRCDKACFSLSHSGNALAVAVSRAAVGVDVEQVKEKETERLAARILTPAEKEAWAALDESKKEGFFYRAWTAKEALYKASGEAVFSPAAWESASAGVKSFEKRIGGEDFLLSVATATPERIRFYENIILKD